MGLFLKLIQFALKTALSVFSVLVITPFPAFAGGVEITSFGHSSLLIKGGGKSVLLNPFTAVGCASGFKPPNVNANLILASSELADEGARISKGTFLVQPGSYRIHGLQIEGFPVDHDRLGGRRFGKATVWKWTQSGMNFAHLGGAAGSLADADKILLGKIDVLIIAVGGGDKVYNAKEAAKIVRELTPSQVIPVHYRVKDTSDKCDLDSVQPFLDELKDAEIKNVGKIFSVRDIDPDNILVNLIN